jgi:hypothetical protein
VAQRYLQFLDALAGRGKGYRGGLFGRGASSRQLQALLAEADEARERLRQEIQARTDYLDSVETNRQATDVDAEETRYLDAIEQQQVEESP